MSVLAINGGTPVRSKPFPKQNTINHLEEEAAIRVLRSDRLTGYQGNWSKNFLGGPEIQELERKWAEKFNVKHAIACNSCTSGLQAACGAIGLGVGNEVIVTPWSMSCSATAPLVWNSIPIFADIEKDYYCLDVKSVEEKITDKTKAIIIVDLFGQPFNPAIIDLAKKHDLYIIEDAAQAIGSSWTNSRGEKRFAGTLGNIGVYSLNYGKHITCGEGGMIVTDDDHLALRCRMIINHAEAVINEYGADPFFGGKIFIEEKVYPQIDITNNMLGFNFRMTEIQAGIASVQLDKFDGLVKQRIDNVKYLENNLFSLYPNIFTIPKIRKNCDHTYYCHTLQYNEKALRISRDVFIEAVKAELSPIEGREPEGPPIGCGYIKPLYLFPLFQIECLSGGYSFPFPDKEEYNEHYAKGSCPTTETLWKEKVFLHRFMGPPTTKEDLVFVIVAFNKVIKNINELE